MSVQSPVQSELILSWSKNQFDIVIQPGRGWASLGLKEVWAYRELLYLLIWREIQGAYRQTALGTSWLFLQPLINMVVLSVVFGGVLGVPSDGVPYPLFSLAALLPWGYFSQATLRGARSLVQNMDIISKVYFPRMVIPIAGALSALVEFASSFVIFIGLMAFYQMPLRWEMLWLPGFLLIAVAFSTAIGMWLATLSVKYRDVASGITFIIQAMMYASPVIYSVNSVPERLRFLYQLNPMTGVIQGFRWALLGSGGAPDEMFFLSIVIVLLILISGAYVFRRTERTVVDIL